MPPHAANQVAYSKCDDLRGRRRVRGYAGFGVLVSESNGHPQASLRAPVVTQLSSVYAVAFVFMRKG